MNLRRHPVVEEDLKRIASAALPWGDLAGTTVLITGANGLVAAYLVEALLQRNEQEPATASKVLALVRDRAKAQARFAAYVDRPDLQFIIQDVCEPLPIREPLHYIIHAASKASPSHFSANPVGTLLPNVLGTYQLLELARRRQTRGFLFLSSGEVYGRFNPPPIQAIAEDQFGSLDPLDPRAAYAEAKRAGEALCLAWYRQYGVPTRIARLGHTYGPGMDLTDERVFADFVRRIVQGEDIVLKSDGSASRPFCYLADATEGLLTVLLKGQGGTAYNLMNDEAVVCIKDLANLLAGLFPERGVRVILPKPSERDGSAQWNPGYLVATQRIRQLGWRPSTSVESGFRRTILTYTQRASDPEAAHPVLRQGAFSR